MEGKSNSGNVACPVCSKLFSQSSIVRHVNNCLNDSEEPSEKDDIILKTRKRKSDSITSPVTPDSKSAQHGQDKKTEKCHNAWGSLQPQKQNVNDSFSNQSAAKKSKKTPMKSPVKNKKKRLKGDAKTSLESGHENDSDSVVVINDDVGSNMDGGSNTKATTKSVKQISGGDSSPETNKAVNTKSTVANGSIAGSYTYNTDSVASVFGGQKYEKKSFAPLAERMRPLTLDEYVGQDKAVGSKSILRSLLQNDNVPSMILWGPPGCGKTTLAKIIANKCKSGDGNIKFRQLSAATSGVNDVKEVIKIAKTDQKMFRKKTILFLDEIHRFNKLQQDSLLPHVEDGTITLIGATTENPSFQVNSALLSRCRVIVLEKLESEDLTKILTKAAKALDVHLVKSETEIKNVLSVHRPSAFIETESLKTLANLCDGDARAALNGLQMAVQSVTCNKDEESPRKCKNAPVVTIDHIKEALQRTHVLYDRNGEEHYNIVSALQKSIRGSDDSAALYWLARMLEGGEDPLYIARRLIRCASEDIGLADPLALNQAVAAFQACHLIGRPECNVILAQCAVYLARAPKSPEMYLAYNKARASIVDHEGPIPSVPLHLRNASTKLMKSLGYGKGYNYNALEAPDQQYMPECLIGTNFFT